MQSFRGRPRTNAFLALFLLAIMLMSPLLPGIATANLARAQDGEDTEPTEEVVEEAPTETPPEEPTTIPTEPAQPTATTPPEEPVEPTVPTATEAPTEVLLVAPTPSPTMTTRAVDASIEIAKHYCPPGYDASNKTLEAMLADCADPGPAAAFTVMGSGFKRDFHVKANARVVLTDIPLNLESDGTISMDEEVPAGHIEPLVFCGWVPESSIQFKASPRGVVAVPIFEEMPDGYDSPFELVCDFFNIPVPNEASLIIEKFACPPGFDTASGSLESLIAECDEPMPGVGFAISAPSIQTQLPTDASGTLTIDGLSPGPVMIEENMPDGYTDTVVYCSSTVPGGVATPYTELPTFGAEGTHTDISLDIPGATYTCLWFNIPEGESEDGIGVPDPIQDNPVDPPQMPIGPFMLTGGPVGEIDMHVLLCQPGYTFENFTIAAMGDCIPGDTGVTFTATDGAGYVETTAPSDGSWRVYFDNVPLDTPITITRDVSSGLGAPFATCDQGNGVLEVVPATNGIQTVVETPTSGAAVERCIWFTVASSGVPTVSVDKHHCPPTLPFDPATASHEDFRLVCDLPGANVQFDIYDSEVEGPFGSETTDTNGQFALEVNPGAIVSVVEFVPDGYGLPIVFCAYGSEQAPAGPYLRAAVAGDGQVTSHPLAGDYTWDCQWFNVVTDVSFPPPLANVSVTTHLCPVDIDPYGIDIADLPTACNAEAYPVEFTVTNGAFVAPLIADGGSTTYSAGNVPAGDITVAQSESSPYQAAKVFCSIEAAGSGATTPLEVPLSANTITQTIGNGQTLSCDWYLVISPFTPGVVMLMKANCPEGFDAYAATLLELGDTCRIAPDDDVEFTLEANGFSSTRSSILIEPGFAYVAFMAVPAGALTISEQVPEGYGDPIVACAHASDALIEDGQTYDPETMYTRLAIIDGNTVNVEYTGDEGLLCMWINVPEGEAGEVPTEEPTEQPTEPTQQPTEQPTEEPTQQPTEQPTEEPTEQPTEEPTEQPLEEYPSIVIVNAYDCTGIVGASSLSFEDLETTCTTPLANLSITVTGDGSFTETTSTGATGAVVFNPVPPGDLLIDGDIPEGQGEPAVYCVTRESAILPFLQPVPEQVTTVDGAFPYSLEPGYAVVCDWFSMAVDDDAETATVTVIKHTCPEGTSSGETESYYLDICPLATGIEFRLTHGDGSAMGVTDANGEYTWVDVPLGPASLQEYIPTGYGEPMVFCNYTYTERPAIDASGGHVSFDILEPGDWICLVYNIPGGEGDLTIVKHTCPEGYDPYAWGADPSTECAEGPNGIAFTANGPNGTEHQATTGDSVPYSVMFGGLQPGAYTIAEQVPDGTGLVFVWNCFGQTMGELRPAPLSVGPSLAIEIGAGESITCHWYNVPLDPDGSLTVIAYTCTTQAYVSEVDCEILESGQGFDLAWWNGDAWEITANGTTGPAGTYTWNDLDAGEYWLDERDGDWCHMRSDWLSDDGNWLNVRDGEETVVKVYTCAGDAAKQGKPGPIPTKYPNTGVPPREDWRLTA